MSIWVKRRFDKNIKIRIAILIGYVMKYIILDKVLIFLIRLSNKDNYKEK